MISARAAAEASAGTWEGPPVLANALADAVAVALPLALALGLTEEAALMGTAVEPAVADAPVAEALAVADA